MVQCQGGIPWPPRLAQCWAEIWAPSHWVLPATVGYLEPMASIVCWFVVMQTRNWICLAGTTGFCLALRQVQRLSLQVPAEVRVCRSLSSAGFYCGRPGSVFQCKLLCLYIPLFSPSRWYFSLSCALCGWDMDDLENVKLHFLPTPMTIFLLIFCNQILWTLAWFP